MQKIIVFGDTHLQDNEIKNKLTSIKKFINYYLDHNNTTVMLLGDIVKNAILSLKN